MFRRVVLLASALAALCGCEASYPTIPTQPDVVARVVLQYRFATVFVAPGSTFGVYMLAVSPDGAYTDVSAQTRYFSSDLTVVRPTSGSAFAGVGPGAAEVVAEYNGFTASLPVSVRPVPRPYPFIELSGFGATAGGTTTIRAILSQGPQQAQTITTLGTWTSSDPSVATVNGGTVEAFKVGTAVITVTFNGLSESIYIPVGPRF